MAAKLYITSNGYGYVVAAPAGEFGFGTIGQASPATTLKEAWRMVQRAGLTRHADKASGRLVNDGPRCAVEYTAIDAWHAPASKVALL
jgi:hypothetical protein